jgi:hypothetical protein
MSRALFLSIFFSQNSGFVFGIFSFGWPCQNSPSTKTATRFFGNTKSGFPNRGYPRLQPVILFERNIRIIATSVSLFPWLRMLDIIWDRFPLEKVSIYVIVPSLDSPAPMCRGEQVGSKENLESRLTIRIGDTLRTLFRVSPNRFFTPHILNSRDFVNCFAKVRMIDLSFQ